MPPKQKALEKKAENEAARKQKEDHDAELREQASWAVGTKDSRKQREDEEKEAEKRRRAAEKAALEASEQAELGQIQRTGKPKKKGKDDFDFLNAALANQPKTKAQKDAEKKKQQEEERRKKEAEAAELREARRKVRSLATLFFSSTQFFNCSADSSSDALISRWVSLCRPRRSMPRKWQPRALW